MTALPSFVELMASLGLEATTKKPDQTLSTCSSPSASPRPASVLAPLHSRSKSIQSLRDASATRQRVSRYAPYSPVLSATRRGSLSSVSSSCSEFDQSPLRAPSSPRTTPSPRLSRRSANKMSVGIYGSASDLAANTPISTYLRRKTPGASPTSPTFPREDVSSETLVPYTVPILPTLLPNSASSDSFPLTPVDSELMPYEYEYSRRAAESLADVSHTGTHSRRSHHAGIRISTPPRSAEPFSHYTRRSFAHVA